MADHTTNEIPYGYCYCGCGQKTWVATKDNPKLGWVKGHPTRYLGGHNRKDATLIAPNPSGLCMCGCGRPTPICTHTDKRIGNIKGHHGKFIKGHGPTRGTLEKRFWERVDKRAPQECWPWLGRTNALGYGTIDDKGTSKLAHRVSYELHVGPIPENHLVCHDCDNPPCCNPAHLFLGTDTENIQDMINKGRGWWQRGNESP